MFFKKTEADKFNFYKLKINYKIFFKKKENRKKPLFLFKILYNIIRKKLLIFKKTLKDLFNKNFIRFSNSKISIFILFV